MTSKAGYWIGGGLIPLAVVAALVWGVVSVFRVTGAVADFQRIDVPGQGRVQLEARKYVIYLEGPNADELVPEVAIAVVRPRTGKALPLARYDLNLNYDFETTGAAVRTVTPPRAGTYRVRTDIDGESGAGYVVAFGDSIVGGLVLATVGALVVGGVLGAVGVALLIVTYVRRSRRSRAPAAR